MSTTPESPNPLGQPLAWDLVADGYMEELVPVFERFAVRALDLASVGPGTRVLDVAAGPGTLALVAAERGAEVTAVDFSPGMIERLRGRAAANGVATVRARSSATVRHSSCRTPRSTPPSPCSASSSSRIAPGASER